MTIRTYAAAAAIAVFGMGISAASAVELRLSHQWSIGDVRHKVAEMIATDVAAAGVDLDIRIFPSESLLKARAVQPFVARSGGHDRLSAVIFWRPAW